MIATASAPAVTPAILRARQAALAYHRRGWQVLPSRTDQKSPALKTWAHFRAERVPEWMAKKAWTSNLQVLTGRRWGLIAIDCDGEQGRDWWRDRVEENGRVARTWVVDSPSGGEHIWFRVPTEGPEIPHGDLFLGEGKHQGVELKGDGSQVVAPPSRYGGGPAYRFRVGPADLPEGPAFAPDWVLALPTLRRRNARAPVPMTARMPEGADGPRLEFDLVETIDRIDPLSYAKSWGLRTVHDRPNPAGWVKCHSVFREDDRPSASFRPDTGTYTEHKGGLVLRFFDLAAALNPSRWPTWRHAANDLGREVGASPKKFSPSRPKSGLTSGAQVVSYPT